VEAVELLFRLRDRGEGRDGVERESDRDERLVTVDGCEPPGEGVDDALLTLFILILDGFPFGVTGVFSGLFYVQTE